MPNHPVDRPAEFLRAIMALSRRVRAERPPGSLSLSGLGILGTLHRLGPLVATRIAIAENLQPQSLTRLVGDLEREKLISRKRSEEDRREITVAITPKGRQALMEDMAVRRAWLENALSAALTLSERETVLAASALMVKLAAYEPFIQDASP